MTRKGDGDLECTPSAAYKRAQFSTRHKKNHKFFLEKTARRGDVAVVRTRICSLIENPIYPALFVISSKSLNHSKTINGVSL